MHRRGVIAAAGALGVSAITGRPALAASQRVDTTEIKPSRAASRLAQVLVARRPERTLAEELMLFGQFVGSWRFTLTELTADGEVIEPGEWHFGWVLEGRGVQDVWIVYGPHSSRRTRAVEYGTTTRVYDPTADIWRVSWSGPLRSRFVQLEGGRDGDEIVLTGAIDGQPTQWIFSDIGPSTFRWRNELSFDGGSSFLVVQDLTADRTR